MAIRIRVYPQNGGLGGAYGYNSQAQVLNERLKSARQTSALQLQYERALANERIKATQLQTAMQYSAGAGYGSAVPLAAGYGALGAGMLGGIPIGGAYGGVPAGYGGVPLGYGSGMLGQVPGMFAGSGQTNVTNQTSAGAATQTVSNNNAYSNYSMVQAPPFGAGFPFASGGMGYGYGNTGGFGSGGLISGLLGALI